MCRINGSGKHNNWSIGNNNVGTFFDPGDDPENNLVFLIAIASFIRGADRHQDLIRWSVASASNDHRLGGHEAPPAIMSVYLGMGSVIEESLFVVVLIYD
jgi:glutamine synthetase